ncbi:hypothetical protein J1N35_007164 [Gossypium stocksii]|uniref:Uncharacterized protein n=1 Tax=Gossypium stocksii TaxID=47602 RepID=A0A9D3W644_9ROSI|nr:hypothetical protein J1N35_007164 [Gossypium stocksii]
MSGGEGAHAWNDGGSPSKNGPLHLFRALAQYRNLAYSCFTFGKGDLVPTVEEIQLYSVALESKQTKLILESPTS